MLQETKQRTFQQDIASGNVLVDFWAPWCGPCRVLHPVLEEIDRERDDLLVLSLNIDENPGIAAEFAVQSIPTVILFRDGEEITRLVGAHPKKILDKELSAHL